MCHKDIGVNTRNWVDLAKDRDYWRTLVNAALNSGFLKPWGYYNNEIIGLIVHANLEDCIV